MTKKSAEFKKNYLKEQGVAYLKKLDVKYYINDSEISRDEFGERLNVENKTFRSCGRNKHLTLQFGVIPPDLTVYKLTNKYLILTFSYLVSVGDKIKRAKVELPFLFDQNKGLDDVINKFYQITKHKHAKIYFELLRVSGYTRVKFESVEGYDNKKGDMTNE